VGICEKIKIGKTNKSRERRFRQIMEWDPSFYQGIRLAAQTITRYQYNQEAGFYPLPN